VLFDKEKNNKNFSCSNMKKKLREGHGYASKLYFLTLKRFIFFRKNPFEKNFLSRNFIQLFFGF
jgi:hypothetical protein